MFSLQSKKSCLMLRWRTIENKFVKWRICFIPTSSLSRTQCTTCTWFWSRKETSNSHKLKLSNMCDLMHTHTKTLFTWKAWTMNANIHSICMTADAQRTEMVATPMRGIPESSELPASTMTNALIAKVAATRTLHWRSPDLTNDAKYAKLL